MGKATGFMEYERSESTAVSPEERIRNFEEFHIPLNRERRRIQSARCMDCGVPFCHSGVVMNGVSSGCPLHNLIPEWNDLIYLNNPKQALGRLLLTNNFPEFTSRVCPAPCEAACTCGLHDQPVTIKENERYLIDNGFQENLIKARPPKVRTDKKIAIVGSGPAGLSAADLLNKRGHSVTVYEKEDRPGGLLMYGIPNMKLEKDVILRRIRIMEQEGVQFVTNADVGKKIKASRLEAEFDAVILACGAGKPRDIQVPGREASGIFFAVDYLKSVTKNLLDRGLINGNGDRKSKGDRKDQGNAIKAVKEDVNSLKIEGNALTKDRRVLVIGGGDTGNDCVGTAIRLGAASVMQLEMMPRLPDKRTAGNPWPQWARVCKTDYGQEESIAVFGKDPRVYETTVKQFLTSEDGSVTGAVTVRLHWKKDPESDRLYPEEIPGSEAVVPADLVLIAAGFAGSEAYVAEAFGVALDERGNLAASQYQLDKESVFAAGDARRGQSLVVWAIREGREAARAVDYKLMGYSGLD